MEYAGKTSEEGGSRIILRSFGESLTSKVFW